jgi:hypothetical protein
MDVQKNLSDRSTIQIVGPVIELEMLKQDLAGQ